MMTHLKLFNIGGSMAYALTIASIDSASKSLNLPFYKVLNPKLDKINFPFPLGNMLGGGAHAGPGTPDLTRIFVSPVGAKSIFEALDMNSKIHKELKKELKNLTQNLRAERVMKVLGHLILIMIKLLRF